MANQFMKADEVAKELGISRSYAYKLIRQLKDELTVATSKHNVDEITFKIIPDPVQMVNALKTKEIDISAAIDGSYISDFMGVEGFDVTQIPDNTTKYLIFNDSIPSAAERQAIAYAVDVEDIIAFAFDDIGYHAKTVGNNKYPDFVEKWNDEEYYEYDEEKAQALFAEAGVSAGKTYRLIYNAADDNAKIVTTIQAALGDFGINVELTPYIERFFGVLPLDAVTTQKVQSFADWMAQGSKMVSAQTLRKIPFCAH